MKRFIAALMLVTGLLVAGLANAAIDNAASTVSSTGVTKTTISLAGSIVTTNVAPTLTSYGGFFLVQGGVYINPDQYPSNNRFDEGVPGTLNLTGTITGLTCATTYNVYTTYGYTNGTYPFGVKGPISITTSSCPAPSAVPTLSEWTQLLLALMTIMLVGWHFHRERSY